jgi:protein tyrosine phosphatase (PTP) superfamily phosphohydrolase (DUF442 family)
MFEAVNTHQVFDWLWTSGQPSEGDLRQFPRLGIETVINLALPSSANALRGEAEIVTGMGMSYFHIPVLWEAPEHEQLRLFFNLLTMFQGAPTWVHCAKNKRVSAFVYLYRKLHLHESDKTSAYPLREIWQPDNVWRCFIDEALSGNY